MTSNIDSKRKKKIHILITLAVMVFIFTQSALPGSISGAESSTVVRLISWLANAIGVSGFSELDADFVHTVVRKLAHFFEYMLLGGCLMVNMHDWYEEKGKNAWHEDTWRLVFASLAVGAVYASTDELHQYFVPERACSLRDVCIDSAGVAVGAILIHLLWLRRIRKENLSVAADMKINATE